MTERNATQVDTIPCEVCLQEIPETVNAEADEYVSNYCGLECYQQWRDKQTEAETE